MSDEEQLARADALAAAVEAWSQADAAYREAEEPACEHPSMFLHNEAVVRAAGALDEMLRALRTYRAGREGTA